MNIKTTLKKNLSIFGITLLLLKSGLNIATAQSKLEINELCGKYGIRTVSFENGKFYLQRNGGPTIELNKIDNGLYKLVTPAGMRSLPNVKFIRTNKRKIKGLQFVHSNGRKENIVIKDTNVETKLNPEVVLKTEIDELISSLSKTLTERYLFPDIAKKYASMLKKNQKSGKYYKETSRIDLATALTTDLNSLHTDGHLRIVTKKSFESMNQRMKARRKKVGKAKRSNEEGDFMFGKILEGNIGYIKIRSFPASKNSQKHAQKVMEYVKDCKAIVFDLNENRGGSVPVIDVITSYLYRKPTHTVSSKSSFENNGKEKKHITKPNKLSKKMSRIPVYVLTSRRTGSAGEHFALVFKTTKRGQVIGKPTFGIAHFATWEHLTKNFRGMIPIGRTYDPKTGKDWEGVGVLPDIDMNPSKSLDWVIKNINK